MGNCCNRLFNNALSLGIALVALGSAGAVCPHAALAQPEQYRMGLVLSDLVDAQALPGHLQTAYPRFLEGLHGDLQGLLGSLGRIETREWQVEQTGDRERYRGAEPVELVAHVIARKLYKIYRNQVVPHTGGDDLRRRTENPYEVISRPAIIGRLEVRLVDPRRNKVLWSGLRDTTVLVPCAGYNYIYNPEKYPGWTPPDLLQTHLAEVMRLDQANTAVHRMLQVADRWFVSYPDDDLRAARGVLPALAAAFYADLDGQLPLEGRIASVLPGDAEPTRVVLNIGAQHGLAPQVRMAVWRPSPSSQKVGQVLVEWVDSTTAIARLSQLEKPVRRRGEGLQPGDRVISRNRSSMRRSPL